MEAHISSATKITQKEPKENTKERGISLTIMGQKSIYNSTHKHQWSPNETLGFNQDDHPYRMYNETGIPEFLKFQIPGLPARSYQTRFYQCVHPTHMYVSHAIQILKNPPEYTMRYSVQPGRNTKNEMHAHLLGNV